MPLLRSWKELGVDLTDVPPADRASMNGLVPGTQTYNEWIVEEDERNPGAADEFLGPTRAALWRSGKLELGDFVNDRNRILTLDQIAKREGIEIE
jgi:hypothetical protein